MKDLYKIVGGVLVGTVMIFGGTTVFGADTNADLQADKEAIAKQYLWAQARLGETATVDLSILSLDEASAAYAELATEKDAFTKENLAEALHDKAVEEGVACGVLK